MPRNDPRQLTLFSPRGESASLTTGSLFSSGGGWEIGAVRAGMRPMWGVEYEAARGALWNATFPGGSPGCMTADVWDERALAATRPVDVLFTSPVCRDYSAIQSRWGEKSFELEAGVDIRSCRPFLGMATVPYVERLRPPVIMLENTARYEGKPAYTMLENALVSRGYDVQTAKLNAKDYGNPSSRERFFAVFTRRDSGVRFRWPDPTHKGAPVSWDSVLAPYFTYLPPAPSVQPALKKAIAAWASSSRAQVYPFLYVIQRQGKLEGGESFPIGLPGKPAPTLTVGHGVMEGWRVVLSPTDFRALGAVGASVLNGFLAPRQFPSSYGAGFPPGLVGNVAGDAVSPIMAEALLRGVSWPRGYRPVAAR